MAKTVSIQGNIGSGKSTLLQHFRLKLDSSEDYIFVDEPIQQWSNIKDSQGTDMLTLFYADKRKHAFAFQMMALSSRHNLLRNAREGFRGEYIVSERSLDADKNVFAKMLHHEGSLSDVEFQIYNNCYKEFVDKDRANEKVIYLRTSPKIASARIAKRARPGEIIPSDYIARCHRVHEEWVRDIPAQNLLVLDANADMSASPQLHETWIKAIMRFISE